MAVIAVYSVKGGVGKTTIAANRAWCSAAISCRRTLLWDLDPAGGAGFLLGLEAKKKRTAGSVFAKDADPEALVRKAGVPNLNLLPADESLRELDSVFARMGKKRRLAKRTRGILPGRQFLWRARSSNARCAISRSDRSPPPRRRRRRSATCGRRSSASWSS